MKDQVALLLVEDEAVIALASATKLRDFGFKVLMAFTGEEAVEKALSLPAQLVLMDIELGEGIDGIEAARRIGEKRDIPILFLSSHTEKEVATRIREVTRYGFIPKSCEEALLLASIEVALRLHDTHRKLRLEEERYRSLSELTSDYLYSSLRRPGGQFHIDWLSGAFEAISGIPIETIMKRDSWLPLVHTEDRRRVLEIWETIQEGEKRTIEFRMVRPTGDSRWIRDHLLCVREGENFRLYGTARDITEHRLSEEALRKREARHSSILSSIRNGIIVAEPLDDGEDFRFTEINPAAEQILMLPRESLVGKRYSELFPHMIESPVTDLLRRVYKTGVAEKIPPSFFEIPGRKGWWTGSFYRLPSGEIVGVFDDITSLVDTKNALEHSHALLQSLLDAVPDAIFFKDREGKLQVVNKTFEAFSRQEAASFLGKPEKEGLPEEAARSYEEGDRLTLESGLVQRFEELFVSRSDGATIPVETLKVPVKDKEGKVIGLVGISRDITIRKQKDELLRNSLKEKDLFLRELRHRVKNSLSLVSSLLSLEGNRLTDPRDVEIFRTLQGRIRSLAGVYDKLDPRDGFRTIPLAPYLQELIETVSLGIGRSDRIMVSLHLEECSLPLKRAAPLGLILNELLINSLKYAFPGGRKGKIRISLEKGEETLLLKVADDGIGLPSGAYPPDPSASSLGLRLVELLAHQIDAQIIVEASAGSCFSILLQNKVVPLQNNGFSPS